MGRKRHGEYEDQQAADADEMGAFAGSGSISADPGDGSAAMDEASEAEEWKSKYLYSLAEMENVRRRARLDVEEARKFGSERLLTDLLPVLDNLNRALAAAEQGGDTEALKSGVELIRRQFSDVLLRSGLERIEAVGQPFDPNLHQAVAQAEPEEGQAPHTVIEELQPGYRLNDRVIRPSMVRVTAG